jgi:hypothetical protein
VASGELGWQFVIPHQGEARMLDGIDTRVLHAADPPERGALMPIAERVTDYSVALLKNDVVDYRQVIKLTTETGHKVFIGFPEQPPAQRLTITGSNTTSYLQQGEFDRIHHPLQTESPLF